MNWDKILYYGLGIFIGVTTGISIGLLVCDLVSEGMKPILVVFIPIGTAMTFIYMRDLCRELEPFFERMRKDRERYEMNTHKIYGMASRGDKKAVEYLSKISWRGFWLNFALVVFAILVTTSLLIGALMTYVADQRALDNLIENQLGVDPLVWEEIENSAYDHIIGGGNEHIPTYFLYGGFAVLFVTLVYVYWGIFNSYKLRREILKPRKRKRKAKKEARA